MNPAANATQTRRVGIQAQLLAWFQEHPNQGVSRDTLATELDDDPERIAHAVYALRAKGEPIDVLVRAMRWRYVQADAPTPGRRLFEELAITKNGDVLVECEDGKVYRLVEL